MSWLTTLGSGLARRCDLHVLGWRELNVCTNPGREWPGAVCADGEDGLGTSAVQIVYSPHRGSREIAHIGSAYGDLRLELLKAVAWQRLDAGHVSLTWAWMPAAGGQLPITASPMGCLLDTLSRACDVLGFGEASGVDEVFEQLVLARIIEPSARSTASGCWRRPGWRALVCDAQVPSSRHLREGCGGARSRTSSSAFNVFRQLRSGSLVRRARHRLPRRYCR